MTSTQPLAIAPTARSHSKYPSSSRCTLSWSLVRLSSSQRLWQVELPIALPVIVAGLRIATVTVVGLVTVTALIGLGGLGYVIVELGYRRFNLTATLAGTIGAIVLAVLADRAFVLLQRALTPWATRRTGRG